jgi:hypothetical protein
MQHTWIGRLSGTDVRVQRERERETYAAYRGEEKSRRIMFCPTAIKAKLNS